MHLIYIHIHMFVYQYDAHCWIWNFVLYNNELVIEFPTVASDSSDEEIEETEEIKNAYIPYLYAKKNIIKVIKDMKRMRFNHIHIVADIQKEYKSIEDETQVWLFSLIFMNDISHKQKSPAQSSMQIITNHFVNLSG